MFERKKKQVSIDPELINQVNNYIENILNPQKTAGEIKQSRDLPLTAEKKQPAKSEEHRTTGDAEERVHYSRQFPDDDRVYFGGSSDEILAGVLARLASGGQRPTFTEELLRYMEARQLTAAQCYKKAHIDRKLFSQIKNNRQYKPRKLTVLAFVMALELNKKEAYSLLRTAGYTFSDNDKIDLIIQYCIEHRIYNLDIVNTLLHKFGQPTLGSK